jgi:hypothetical protein
MLVWLVRQSECGYIIKIAKKRERRVGFGFCVMGAF